MLPKDISSRSCENILSFYDLGLVGYQESLELQKKIHRSVESGSRRSTVLIVEHSPVLTLGKHSDPGFICKATEDLVKKGVQVERTDRGGEVTAHMPGQIIFYPIINLATSGFGVKKYVEGLENTVIQTLALVGIVGTIDPEHPGVWVAQNKICAIGVRISKKVSLHGFALNFQNNLDLFEDIIPCGIRDRGVTSVAIEAASANLMAPTREIMIQHLAENLASELAYAGFSLSSSHKCKFF